MAFIREVASPFLILEVLDEFSINPQDITHAAITRQHLNCWEDSAFNFNYVTNGISTSIDEWAKSNISRLPKDKFLSSPWRFFCRILVQLLSQTGYTLDSRGSNDSNHSSSSISSSIHIVNNFDVNSSLGYSYPDNEFSRLCSA